MRGARCEAMLSRDVADVSLGCRQVSPGVASCLEVSHGCHIVSFGRHVYTYSSGGGVLWVQLFLRLEGLEADSNRSTLSHFAPWGGRSTQ